MDITEIRSKSLGRSFLPRTVRPVPKLWLQNWHHKITTKDDILNCELHFAQSYYYYKLKNIVLWICSKVHNVKIMMMMMMIMMMTTTTTTTMMMMITITVYYYYCYYYFLIIQSQAAFVNCLYVATFTIVHSTTQIKFPLLLLTLLFVCLLFFLCYSTRNESREGSHRRHSGWRPWRLSFHCPCCSWYLVVL